MRKTLRVLLSGILLGWLAWRLDGAALVRHLAGLRLELWLGACGLYLVAQALSSLRWQALARPLGFDQTWPQFTGYYFIGMFFNLFLPTSVGGDVIRAWYLDGGSGRRQRAFLTVLLDRGSGLLLLLVLACVGSFFLPPAIPGWVGASVWSAAGCAALGLALLPVAARRAGPWQKALARFPDLLPALRRMLRPSVFALSLAVQALNVILVWLLGRAVGVDVPLTYYAVLVPMVTLLTLAPVSLNGMGVREGGTVLFLAPWGVETATAVGLAFLWFLVFTAASLVGGGLYLCGGWPRPERLAEHEPVRGDSGQGRAGQPRAAA